MAELEPFLKAHGDPKALVEGCEIVWGADYRNTGEGDDFKDVVVVYAKEPDGELRLVYTQNGVTQMNSGGLAGVKWPAGFKPPQ
jgi:hypothetical protein